MIKSFWTSVSQPTFGSRIFILGHHLPDVENHCFKPVVLNRRDASRYRDLETISPGLTTLCKLKLYQKMHKNQVFLYKKTWKIIVTGTIDHKTNVYRDKRRHEIFYRDLNQKRLRTTALDNIFRWPWTPLVPRDRNVKVGIGTDMDLSQHVRYPEGVFGRGQQVLKSTALLFLLIPSLFLHYTHCHISIIALHWRCFTCFGSCLCNPLKVLHL